MERLTKRDGKHAYFPRCFEEPCDGAGCQHPNDCPFIREVCEKLCAFEDAVELGQMAPVKIGDKVYLVSEDEDDGGYRIDHQTVNGVGRDCFFVCDWYTDDGSCGSSIPFDQIGKDVFLELEEARAEVARLRKERRGGRR